MVRRKNGEAVEGERPKMKGRRALLLDLGTELSKLMTAARVVAQDAADNLHPGISAGGFQILQWLHAFGPTKASAIAEALSMDRSVISRLAKELRELGFIDTAADRTDGRSVVYRLAEPTRDSVGKAIAYKGNLFEKRVGQWPDADLAQLAGLLRRLNERDA
jgi:DNA-binding MarR family transcriptional regulator